MYFSSHDWELYTIINQNFHYERDGASTNDKDTICQTRKRQMNVISQQTAPFFFKSAYILYSIIFYYKTSKVSH